MSGENEPSPSGENTYLQNEIGREGEQVHVWVYIRMRKRGRELAVYTKIIFGLVHANS